MESPPDAPTNGPSTLYRSAWGFYLVVAVVGIVWLGAHHDSLHLGLFFDPERWWLDLGIGLAAGAGLIALWWLGRYALSGMRSLEAQMRAIIGPLDGSEILALALISGFSEELLFRGAMQASWGWPWALAIFTLLHTGPGPSFRYWTVFALIAGALFGWITLLRGNLLPAIVGHVVVNGVNLALLVDRPGTLEESEEVGVDDGIE